MFPIVGYHVAYINGIHFGSYLASEDKMPLLQYKALNEYGSDFLALVMDLTLEAEALGAEVSYSAIPPSISKHLSFTESHIDRLSEIRDEYLELGRLGVMLRSARKLVELNRSDKVVCGYITGPLTLVSNLFSPETVLKSFIKEPDKLNKSLKATTSLQVHYVRALAETGLDAIVILEPIAALISPQHYVRHLARWLQTLFGEIKQKGLVGILHVCGKAVKIVRNMGESGAHILSLDHHVDLVEAVNVSNKVVMGNVPTAHFLGDPERVRTYTVQMIEKTRGFKHIIASGCEIPAHANPEAVKALSLTVAKLFSRSNCIH